MPSDLTKGTMLDRFRDDVSPSNEGPSGPLGWAGLSPLAAFILLLLVVIVATTLVYIAFAPSPKPPYP